MSHSNTEQLIDYWRGRASPGVAPARASIDPTQLTHILPQIFILRRRAPRKFHFRLVGGFVADLHGRDLREEPFNRLWNAEDRTHLELAMEAARRRAEPLIVECRAFTDSGARLDLEMPLAPLASADGEVDRLIGLYQPVSPVAALMGQPLSSLALSHIRAVGAGRPATPFPHLRLAAVDGRRIA